MISPSFTLIKVNSMPHEFKHILVPVDFSKDSDHAVNTALRLFADKAETITLLTICEPSSNFTIGKVNNAPEEIQEMIAKNTEKKIEDFIQKYQKKYKNVKMVVRNGQAAQQILLAADDMNVDLIVMGSHGTGSIARVLFGSTTYDVARKASCSVFIIRS
jgi:nucleotide-binding universal stress UspA family protein